MCTCVHPTARTPQWSGPPRSSCEPAGSELLDEHRSNADPCLRAVNAAQNRGLILLRSSTNGSAIIRPKKPSRTSPASASAATPCARYSANRQQAPLLPRRSLLADTRHEARLGLAIAGCLACPTASDTEAHNSLFWPGPESPLELPETPPGKRIKRLRLHLEHTD